MEVTPVAFEDVTIHRATILPKTGENSKHAVSIMVGVLDILTSALTSYLF